eukprot:758176-Hanusia_phi.AAC.1
MGQIYGAKGRVILYEGGHCHGGRGDRPLPPDHPSAAAMASTAAAPELSPQDRQLIDTLRDFLLAQFDGSDPPPPQPPPQPPLLSSPAVVP